MDSLIEQRQVLCDALTPFYAKTIFPKSVSLKNFVIYGAEKELMRQSQIRQAVSVSCGFSADISTKRSRYDAHIYTDEELQSFFDAVDKSQSVPDSCPYRADVMPVFFRILYTSGMRVSELRLARIRDINFGEGYITVHEAKNHKERYVPIHPLLMDKCKELKEKIHVHSSDDEYFFMLLPGRPMTLGNVYKNFRRYLEQAGISHTGKGPRIHDFRHTYCVNLLRKWSDEGKDLIAYLPYMRTMLGHESFEETAYYLKLTAERFPYIKERMMESFPDLIREAVINEHEFY